MSEPELLRSAAQKVSELQAELAAYQEILNLASGRDRAALSEAESPSPAPAAPRAGASAADPEFNRDVLEHLTDGFAQMRADGTLSYFNRAFAQLLSLPEDSSDALHLTDVEHLAACEPFAAALKAVLSGTPQYARCTLSDAQGHRRVVECAATPVPSSGHAFSAALVIRDQTEREQLVAHLTALNMVATALTRTLNFEQRLGFALTAARDATAADAAVIYLLDDDRQHLALAGADGLSAQSVAELQAYPLPLNEGAPGAVARDGQARALAEIGAATSMPGELVGRERLASAVFVALRDAQQVSGVLGICTRARRLFTEADIQLLTSMANHVGLSLYNARLHEQLLQQAQHDGLTGLYNRGHLMELAAREYQRALRHRSPLMVLMIDVNDFKAVNDRSGHMAGDQALQAVAGMLREQTRTFDLVGRYGGDEFVVVLVDCTHAYAFEVIRRLHQAAQAIRIATDTGPLAITLSVGMAACKLTESETLDNVLAEADREMYALKNGGGTGAFSLPRTA